MSSVFGVRLRGWGGIIKVLFVFKLSLFHFPFFRAWIFFDLPNSVLVSGCQNTKTMTNLFLMKPSSGNFWMKLKWYFLFGLTFYFVCKFIFPIMIFLILLLANTINNSSFSYWLTERLYFSLFETVGNSSFHEVKNQNFEIKEFFTQQDVISARQFKLEILNIGYDNNGQYKKDIDEFLENDDINQGKTSFIDNYCYVNFKITNLVTRYYRIDGRNIIAINVSKKNNNFQHITFYPSNDRNTRPMNHAGDWKTGIVAFDCDQNKNSTYQISFSSCALRDGCGDENENSCLGNPSCPYKTHEEYTRNIKIEVGPFHKAL